MNTYNPEFFNKLKEDEKKHFWFKVRRKWIYEKIYKYVPPPANIVEVGCGSGNISHFLSGKGYHVTGCDYFDKAFAYSQTNFKKVIGNALSLPFKHQSYDIVCFFDVIEHFDKDLILLKEARRILKPHGMIAITVPANMSLWSYFDIESCHKRRYTKKEVLSLLISSRFKPLSVNYMFLPLYIPMKFRSKKNKGHDEFAINDVVNKLAFMILEMERIMARMIPIPFGTSIIALGIAT